MSQTLIESKEKFKFIVIVVYIKHLLSAVVRTK